MTDSIDLQPITTEAFAPFGTLVQQGAIGEPGPEIIDDLVNIRPWARARLSLAAVPVTPMPFEVVMMERHAYSSQAFVPTDCAAYLVLVAPKGAEGLPDMARSLAFRVPGETGIIYRPDVWHHPIAALEQDGRFAVLTFVDGTAADQEIVRLDRAVTIKG